MSNFKLSFLFVPGEQSSSDSDIFSNDKVIGCPYHFIEKAIQETKQNSESIFIYLKGSKWNYEKSLPVEINKRYAVEVNSGELKSHDYIFSL